MGTRAGAIAAVCALLLAQTACSQSPVPDAWEAAGPPLPRGSQCYGIERDLVIPVVMAHRSEAIALLEHTPIVPLDAGEAARLTASGRQNLTASTLVKDAIMRLTQEKESSRDELRLVQLERLGTSPRLASLRPFLVRGIVKNEGTGGFAASWCGDDLLVSHLSLGARTPPSTRAAVVVFLEKVPAHVRVTGAMAK